MADTRQRLVITDHDLAAPAAPAQTPPPAPSMGPGTLPSVAGVRPAPLQVGAAPLATSSGSVLRSTLAISIVGALVATLVAWVPDELVFGDGPDTSSNGRLIFHSAMSIGLFGAFFGAIYSAWDDIMGGVWSKVPAAAGIGLAIGAVCGAISGAIAQALYAEIVDSLLADVQTLDELVTVLNGPEFYFARALAWGIFGLGIGVAVAAPKRSTRKLINGMIGGIAGGALGGLFFHWIGNEIESGAISRLLGLTVVGLGIGVAIGLVEMVRRQAWLRIVAGGMAGKEFIVYHQSTNFGSSPKCQITLIKDPAVGPFHFRIDEHNGRRSLQAFDGCPVAVNGAPVAQHWLRNGDVIQAGHTSIQYSERTVA